MFNHNTASYTILCWALLIWIGLSPPLHAAWDQNVYALIQQKQWQKALALLKQQERNASPHPLTFYYKGLVLQAQGHLQQALQSYQQAQPALDVRLQPWLHNNIGVIHFQQKRYIHALRAFQRALRRKPFYVRAQYNYEITLKKMNQPPPPPRSSNARKKPPPPQRNKRTPPRKPPKKQALGPAKQKQFKTPKSIPIQLKAFDVFLPYHRLLRYRKKRPKSK